MKKIMFSLFLVLLLVAASNADDRFIFIGVERNGCEWFIDKFSVSQDSVTGVISYWTLQKFSTLYRQKLMEMAQNEKQENKYIAQQATYAMILQNINPKNKTFRNSEAILYDKDWSFLDHVNFYEWIAIVPTSPVEYIFNWLKHYFPQMFH